MNLVTDDISFFDDIANNEVVLYLKNIRGAAEYEKKNSVICIATWTKY